MTRSFIAFISGICLATILVTGYWGWRSHDKHLANIENMVVEMKTRTLENRAMIEDLGDRVTGLEERVKK